MYTTWSCRVYPSYVKGCTDNLSAKLSKSQTDQIADSDAWSSSLKQWSWLMSLLCSWQPICLEQRLCRNCTLLKGIEARLTDFWLPIHCGLLLKAPLWTLLTRRETQWTKRKRNGFAPCCPTCMMMQWSGLPLRWRSFQIDKFPSEIDGQSFESSSKLNSKWLMKLWTQKRSFWSCDRTCQLFLNSLSFSNSWWDVVVIPLEIFETATMNASPLGSRMNWSIWPTQSDCCCHRYQC